MLKCCRLEKEVVIINIEGRVVDRVIWERGVKRVFIAIFSSKFFIADNDDKLFPMSISAPI